MAYDFDKIARTYDRLNRMMTLGLDRRWRKRAVKGLQGNVLDVACGTGDMMVELAKLGCNVTGVDISEEIARQKVKAANFQLANAEALPFAEGKFDAVTCAFGVRNFVHLEKGLGEMLRVLKPGGRLLILELATPDSKLIRPFYSFYTKRIIPWLGSRIAGNRDAYTYLPNSIARFPKGDAFLKIVHHSSLNTHHCKERKLTFGVCRLYSIEKS